MFSVKDEAVAGLMENMCSLDYRVAEENLHKYAKALELPLRRGIFDCDNHGGIFEMADFTDPRSCPEFPLDPIKPGTEDQYVAHAIPDCSCLPCTMIQGDYVIVPTYMIGHCVEWCIKRARFNNFIAERSIDAFRAGFVKKMNNDAWHVILAAGLDRNIIVSDAAAAQGQFTKRLVIMMKTLMRRNGGGNASCTNRARLTDLYMSPELMDDIYNWNIDQVPEDIQTEIHRSPNCDMGLTSLFCVNFHILDELGVGQEYQLYYENELGGAMPPQRQEIVVGLDLANRDSFVMPVRQPLEMFADMTEHKCMREGVYGWSEQGFSVLNSQRVLLAAV